MKKLLQKMPPVMLMLLVGCGTVAGVWWLEYWFQNRQRPLEVSVTYGEAMGKGKEASGQVWQSPDAMNPQGEMYMTATRVREASALLVSAALLTVQARAQGMALETAQQVGSRVVVPPGVTARSAGIWESQAGSYYLRYRNSPMAFEIVVIPQGKGPRSCLRLDPRATETEGLKYWEATSEGAVEFPLPFAAAATFLGKGWVEQRLHTNEIKPEEKQALKTIHD